MRPSPSLRDAGYPAEAVRAYLEELDLPRHDVHLDLDRIRSLSVDVLADLDDEELARRAGVPVAAAPLLRGAHDLVEGAGARRSGARAGSGSTRRSPETLERFVELRARLAETLDEGRGEVAPARAEGGRRQPARRCGSR